MKLLHFLVTTTDSRAFQTKKFREYGDVNVPGIDLVKISS